MSDPFPPGMIGPPMFSGDRPQYVNGVQVNVSPWDFVVSFQQQSVVGEVDGEPQVAVVPVARIVMSPQHAKAMAIALTETVGKFEEQFGALPDMRDIVGGGA